MNFKEQYRDLFTVEKSYYLAHCIASDFRMGAGIAVQFQKKFSLRKQLQETKLDTSPGSCVLIKKVFNLITKRRSSGKPTYDTLQSSLDEMKRLCQEVGVEKIAMPKIGCGLDRLHWGRVKTMIQDTFKDLDVEILICNYK